MGTHPPAGWYDDPTDPRARRFWDGDEWTPLVAGGDVTAPAPVSDPAPAPDPVPTESRPTHGWYADPADSTRRRYWDGDTWTSRVLDQALQPAVPLVLGPDVPAPATTARDQPLSPLVPQRENRDPAGGGGAAEAGTPSTTATAIADLMATADTSATPDDDAVEPAPRRRTAALAVGLLVLVAAVGLTVTNRGPDAPATTAVPTTVPVTEAPATTAVPTTVPAAEPGSVVLEGFELAAAYVRCQDVVKASALSTDVRLVFERVEDIAVDDTGARPLIEFWVREQGDRAEDQRVAFICLGGEDDAVPPSLFMQI